MYAVAFDLVVADTEKHHPKGVSQAYADIAAVLNQHGFRRLQGSLYVTDDEDMAKLFVAMQDLKRLPWIANSIRDIRAFRVEQWSNFTEIIRQK